MTRRRDLASLVELCEQLLSGRGEASGVALARENPGGYAELTTGPRIAFFEALATAFGARSRAHRRGDRCLAGAGADRGRGRRASRRRAAPAGAVPPAQSRARRHRRAGAHARAAARRASSTATTSRRSIATSCICSRPGSTAASWCCAASTGRRRRAILEKIIRYEAVHADPGLGRSAPPHRSARPALLRLLPSGAGRRAADLRRGGADARHSRRRSRRSCASERDGVAPDEPTHGGVLFDLQLPARACRRLLRQFPDQAGGRGDLARELPRARRPSSRCRRCRASPTGSTASAGATSSQRARAPTIAPRSPCSTRRTGGDSRELREPMQEPLLRAAA